MANNELSGPVSWRAPGPPPARARRAAAADLPLRCSCPRRSARSPTCRGSAIGCASAWWRATSSPASGTPAGFTYKRSRRGDSLADRAAEHVLAALGEGYQRDRLLPARQRRAPVLLAGLRPAGGLAHALHCTDSFSAVPHLARRPGASSPRRRSGAACEMLPPASSRRSRPSESSRRPMPYGEPQLGPRGLYPTTGGALREVEQSRADMMFLLNYCDGRPDLLAAAERWSARSGSCRRWPRCSWSTICCDRSKATRTPRPRRPRRCARRRHRRCMDAWGVRAGSRTAPP